MKPALPAGYDFDRHDGCQFTIFSGFYGVVSLTLLSQPIVMSSALNNNPTLREILRPFLERKPLWLVVLSCIFIISVFTLRYHILSYSSTVTLMVVDGLKGDKNFNERNLPDYLLPSDQFNRLQQTILSNAMFDHLIKRFGLYKHYNIDTTREFHYEHAIARLRDNISLKKTPFNTITVSVTDHYRYIAYEMANEIASYSDTLNRKLLRGLQAKRLAMYKRIDKQIEERIVKKQSELEALLMKLDKGMKGDESVIDLRRSILALQNIVDDHGTSVKEQYYILESLDDRNFPTVMIQQKALPGSQSLLLPAIIFSILAVILSVIALLFVQYLRISWKAGFLKTEKSVS